MVDQVIQKQRAAKGYFWYISRDFLTIELGLDRPVVHQLVNRVVNQLNDQKRRMVNH